MFKLSTALLVLIAAASTAFTAAQTLKITSPASGTVAHPGNTISVIVSSSDGEFKIVSLVGEDPFGFSIPQSHLPAVFHLSIPEKTYPRTSSITAVGLTIDGKEVYSEPIQIDIELTNLPVKLKSQMPELIFGCPTGIPDRILLTAVFNDGSAVGIDQSSKITYSSANPAVAQVDDQGLVYPRSPGKTVVTATYREGDRRILLAIPVTVEVGPIALSTYSLSFGVQPVGASSAKKIVLKNRTAGPVRILGVNASPDFSETDNCLSSSPIWSQGTCTVNVTFSPSNAGPRKGMLTIIDDFSSERLGISLSGTGQ